jgi:peptide/nickel transport system ATP-binding protein
VNDTSLRSSRPADVLRLEGVQVRIPNGAVMVDDISLTLNAGEIVCLVGESGSGKTTTALTAFGYCAPNLRISEGKVVVADRDVDYASLHRIRGREIAYVPQNPGGALNPSMRVVDAVADMVRIPDADRASKRATALEMLDRVGLPATEEFGRRYPHQLSGGQQQRVCIAAALASNPKVVVLDEPTTGLDVVTQDRILTELLRLRDEQHVSMLYVTHDLAVAAQIADRIVVVYGGYIVEEGPAEQVLRRPAHPYTRGLLRATPDHAVMRALSVMQGVPVDVGDRPPGCAFSPRCGQKVDACESVLPEIEPAGEHHGVRCPRWRHTPEIDWAAAASATLNPPSSDPEPVLRVTDLCAEHKTRRGTVVAAAGISFDLRRGECVALVGESGSGKTTIARVIAGLHPTWSGSVCLGGTPLKAEARHRSREQRRNIQIVFQSPTDTLNPRHTVGQTLMRPVRTLRGLSRKAAEAEVKTLLDAVHVPTRFADRYPRELSGGQRQRIGIARALAADPDVIVCDEITSALDVSVQARILELLRELQKDRGVSLLFVTHDLGVVATIASEVLVLEKGLICESGPSKQLLAAPEHDYTKKLLDAAPSLHATLTSWQDVPDTAEAALPG